MLRPEIIDAMSEEMGRVYEACVSRTLVNMARYFRYVPDGEQPLKTTYWQARKLAQLGQINRETLAIMGSLIGHMDKGITAALNKVINDSVRYVEPSLLAATKKGFLQPAAVPELTESMAQVFELYYKQAADKTNLVSTVMLDSTRQAYMQAVSDVTAQTQLDERIRNTQTILNEAAGTVISGVDTFNKAQRAAVRSMVRNGLTGFVDHAGHKWRPETYVAMDIRTTLANTAREATMQRCEDYGSDLIQVSSHSGARPLCYPWQGKVLSTTDNARTVKDADGNEIQVIGLHSTSYGQAAGLFGVNCGHFPTPFIPGFSALSDQSMIQPEKENEITYQQSQMQRALERKMRDAKTYLDVAKATNDPELIKEARGMVDKVDEALADFCDSTGRTRRKDREYLPVRATWPDVEPGRYAYTSKPTKPIRPTVTPKPAEPINYGQPFNHYRKKNKRIDGYFDSAKQALDRAPAAAQRVWSANADKLKPPIVPSQESGAFYRRTTGYTYYESYKKAFEESTYQRENVVFFHEYGHNIDNVVGRKHGGHWFSLEYKGGAFGQTIMKECEQNIREYYMTTNGYKDGYDVLRAQQNGPGGMGFGSFVRQALRSKMGLDEYRNIRGQLIDAGDDDNVLRPLYDKYLTDLGEQAVSVELHKRETGRAFCDHVKSHYSIYEMSDISDMFEPYTVERWGIEYPFGVGHGTDYARDKQNLPLEAFAEMYSATVTQNDSLTTIREFFPESYKVFEEMLEEMRK